jgi:hypothetical protein
MTAAMIQTPYGIFSGVITTEHTPGGALLSIRLEEQNMILTHAGALIPFYGEETVRRKHKPSVTFHQNGMIKAVALEAQTNVETPIGALPAELITFYDTGEVHRVFPLDGKISGFWSEEEERALNIPLSFDLGFTAFTALLSGISFYKSGQIKSVTLFPEERIVIGAGALGQIPTRCGLSLYESGALRSLEPAEPTKVKTPIGVLSAYDVTAHGINADTCSLCLDEAGRVTRIVTSGDRITVERRSDGSALTFTPKEIYTDDDGTLPMTLPVELDFNYTDKTVSIYGADSMHMHFLFSDDFIINNARFPLTGCSFCNCLSCQKCISSI